ncbi:hypothetical protein BS78_K321500 [Paspalum vaginatum]|uniref:DUF8039 domain-containing protein n=1 Tax=Paspalum vaginatum TaxID=158149 RepID=A0A9W7X7P7_9POAL|nr:hypothetical protein BS78_K321500 [Paspalum vaginatum]
MDNRESEKILQQMILDGTHDDEENASHDTDAYLNLENEDTGAPENANEDTDAPNDQSASVSKKKSSGRGPTSMKNFEGRLIIEEFREDRQPLSPAEAATKSVNYCGYLVRDNVPIRFRTWRPSCLDDPHAVPNAQKAMLWEAVKEKFNVEDWTLKKMAEQFCAHKKKLYEAFKKKGKVPNFDANPKYRGHWDAFINYKLSEKGTPFSARNQESALQKEYYHSLGPGGYKASAAKWAKMEADLEQKGITPATQGWLDRLKRWYFRHHGTLVDDGTLVYKDDKAKEIAERVIEDDLSLILQNPDYPGRTRGYGNLPWKLAFSADAESYRIRHRSKAIQEARVHNLENELAQPKASIPNEVARQVAVAIESIRMQGILPPPANMHSPEDPGHTRVYRSSCASTDLPDQRYPVDEIEHRTRCELHIPAMNLTTRYHSEEIPEGYLVVSVDEVCEGYGDLELTIPGGDDERRLAEAVYGFIIWKKPLIVIRGDTKSMTADPRTRGFFMRIAEANKKKLVSNYDRMMKKAATQQKRCKLNDVPNPGEEPQATAPMLATREELDKYAKQCEVVWKYEYGKPLVKPELVKHLPTQMRTFYSWYMKKSKAKKDYLLGVRVKDTYYFNGIDLMFLEFKDIYEVYHRGALPIALVSCWVLMEIQMCRKQGIYNVGFMDPVAINQKTIIDHCDSVKERVLKFCIDQLSKKIILLPYNWELCVSHAGLRPKLKITPNFPCFRQVPGTNLCGHYVCEFIHNCMLQIRDELLPEDRIKAVQEGLKGFINNEIISSTGEFFDTGERIPPPDDYVPNL